MRICCNCKLEKSHSDFNKDKNKKDGISYICSECSRLKSKEWYAKNSIKQKEYFKEKYLENREYYLEQAKIWRYQNKDKKREYNRARKALLKNLKTEEFTEKDILNTYGNDCHICNSPIDMNAPRWTASQGWEMSLHFDHVIPISKGGANSIENVRPSHAICNIKKSDSLL